MELVITIRAAVESQEQAKALTDTIAAALPKQPPILITGRTSEMVDSAKSNA